MNHNLRTVGYVLDSLHPKTQLNLSEISTISGISRLHATPIIEKLEREGMIRVSYPQKKENVRGYSKFVVITHKGMMLKWAIRLAYNMAEGRKEKIYPSLEQLLLYSNMKRWREKEEVKP